MLWAWERPSDLGFLNPHTTGVSLLVESIWLTPQGVEVEPNANRVLFPSGTWLMACTRIEVPRGGPSPELSDAQARAAADEIAALARIPHVRAIQIDFDATRSQRAFYRQLLAGLRRQLPPGYPISITALASWCGGDDWLRGLPVQEAVPMLFRMGPDQSYRALVEAGRSFREPLCGSSAGLSGDEDFFVPGHKRLYLFAAHGWSPAVYRRMMAVSNSGHGR